MPKLKTHSGTKDRVRVTKNGKILHGHPTSNHFLSKKSAARKRRFAVAGVLSGKAATNIKRKLGI